MTTLVQGVRGIRGGGGRGPGDLHRLCPGQGRGLGHGEEARGGGGGQHLPQGRGLEAEQWGADINMENDCYSNISS